LAKTIPNGAAMSFCLSGGHKPFRMQNCGTKALNLLKSLHVHIWQHQKLSGQL